MEKTESKTLFCGSGRKKFDNLIKLYVVLDDIPAEYIKTNKQGKRYVSLDLCTRRQEDEWGNGYFIRVDAWKPTSAVSGEIKEIDELSEFKPGAKTVANKPVQKKVQKEEIEEVDIEDILPF